MPRNTFFRHRVIRVVGSLIIAFCKFTGEPFTQRILYRLRLDRVTGMGLMSSFLDTMHKNQYFFFSALFTNINSS